MISLDMILAGIAALAFSALQLILLRRVVLSPSGGARAALLAVKLPLWALALLAAGALGGGVLSAFGLTAGAVYPAAALVYYFRMHKGE